MVEGHDILVLIDQYNGGDRLFQRGNENMLGICKRIWCHVGAPEFKRLKYRFPVAEEKTKTVKSFHDPNPLNACPESVMALAALPLKIIPSEPRPNEFANRKMTSIDWASWTFLRNS